jgi:hypothetical protein
MRDEERHKRFLDMTREVEASDDPKDFDRAFDRVLNPKKERSIPTRRP